MLSHSMYCFPKETGVFLRSLRKYTAKTEGNLDLGRMKTETLKFHCHMFSITTYLLLGR